MNYYSFLPKDNNTKTDFTDKITEIHKGDRLIQFHSGKRDIREGLEVLLKQLVKNTW
ncbi:MAG: hypothetical protein K0S47_4556 [Herbinix sp.]|jgi:hypothetical protein|nr:hypothetical protein [Herbinix sp.]